MDKFTVEEMNLICIYDYSDRERLIEELRGSMSSVYDPEMLDIMHSVIAKLERMTDDDYADTGFYIADEYDEYNSQEGD